MLIMYIKNINDVKKPFMYTKNVQCVWKKADIRNVNLVFKKVKISV